MTEAHAQASRLAMPAEETLIFEQPLSERMRTFLRLDFLYGQALYHNEMSTSWRSPLAAMSARMF